MIEELLSCKYQPLSTLVFEILILGRQKSKKNFCGLRWNG